MFCLRLIVVLACVAIAAAAPIATPPSSARVPLFLSFGLFQQLSIAAAVIATLIALGLRTRRKLAEEWPEDSDKIADVEDRFTGFLDIPVSEPVEEEKLAITAAED